MDTDIELSYQEPLYAAIDIANRSEAVRVAVHLLAGGDPGNMPSTWRSAGHVWPPGPAAEFGHCLQGIARANHGQDMTDALRSHEFLGKESQVGLVLVPNTDKQGRGKAAMKLPDAFDVMVAGAPCLNLMLARAASTLQSQVRGCRAHKVPVTVYPQPSRHCRAMHQRVMAVCAGSRLSEGICCGNNTGNCLRVRVR